MANIVIPTTLVADTGTGATLVPYRLDGDQATFVEQNPAAQAAVALFKRTEPKATKDYAGAQRGEVRYTEMVADSNGRYWPVVHTTTTSIPAFMTDANKAAFVTRATALNGLAVARDALGTKVIPQS